MSTAWQLLDLLSTHYFMIATFPADFQITWDSLIDCCAGSAKARGALPPMNLGDTSLPSFIWLWCRSQGLQSEKCLAHFTILSLHR